MLIDRNAEGYMASESLETPAIESKIRLFRMLTSVAASRDTFLWANVGWLHHKCNQLRSRLLATCL